MKTEVICEISSNFESLRDIVDSIDYAKSVGAVPKLQAFLPQEIAKEGTDYFKKLESVQVPRDWMKKLKGSGVFYSVFGLDSLKFLEEEINPHAYKIASGKAVDKALVQAVARTGKHVYISVGGCTLDEIRQVTKYFMESCGDMLWWTRLTLMHCVMAYPSECAYMGNLRDRINGSKLIQWGYSDHTTDLVAPVMAVTLGSSVIEKHFAIRPMSRPDSGHSLFMPDFSHMVSLIGLAEGHLKTHEQPLPEEMGNLVLARGKWQN